MKFLSIGSPVVSAAQNPLEKQVETYLLWFLSLLQKYGVLFTIILILISMALRYLAKIRKNTRVQQRFTMFAWGMFVICIILTILPYIVLHYLEQQG